MPLGYDIYEDIGLLYIRGQGEITQHQRMSAVVAWLREPTYEDCSDALMDLAGVKTTPRPIQSMKSPCKWAFVLYGRH